jgi:hypothetical protein
VAERVCHLLRMPARLGTALAKRAEDSEMPVNVVRTPDEEIAWERAKARAREEYPDATGERFYRIVMAIYKKMARYEPRSRPASSRRFR